MKQKIVSSKMLAQSYRSFNLPHESETGDKCTINTASWKVTMRKPILSIFLALFVNGQIRFPIVHYCSLLQGADMSKEVRMRTGAGAELLAHGSLLKLVFPMLANASFDCVILVKWS